MCEFRKLLNHLNQKLALPVCILTVLNLSYTFSAILYFIKIYNRFASLYMISMKLINVVLWLVLGLYPFFQVKATVSRDSFIHAAKKKFNLQASSLTSACDASQSCGHQVRIRSFVHHNTSTVELDSVLLFASSLKLKAKLYKMPIRTSHVFFVIVCIVIATLTLGMCLNITLNII